MVEQTEKIPTPNQKPPETTQEQLRQLIQHAKDLIELLRTQREILRQRGMNLPSGALDNLKTMQMRLEALSKQMLNAQIELRQLRALADTTALINSSLDTNEVLNRVMDTVIRLTSAERGYIMLKNKDSGEMEFRVARGMDQAQLGKEDFTVSRTIVGEVASTGEPILTDNAVNDPRYQGHESIVGFALRSILCVPLKVRDEVIGVAYCDNRILSGLFKKHDLELLTAFAHQAAVAIENASLFEAARRQLAEITEMRDLMDNIFTSIASGVITIDTSSTVLTYNAAAERIICVPRDKALGRPLGEVMPSINGDFNQKLQYVFEAGAQQLVETQPVLDGLGQRFWNLIISPLRDALGTSYGVAIVVDDLTEIKQREAQLAEVRRYLPPALVENLRNMDVSDVGGQEREITAIFADVRGFTTFSEHLQPEVLMEIINKYLSLASDAINLYEGVVDKYMGDAVTGLFNTQLNPQPDHAARAVRAAMSMMYDLFALHEIMPEEQRLFYGVGIHTGMAVLGNVGSQDRKEFAAIGDATDLSKLLQENAGRGEIIISPGTYELVKDFFECEAMEPHKTKNRTDLKVVYKVLKRKKGAGTGQLSPGV